MSVVEIDERENLMHYQGLPLVPLRELCATRTGIRNPGLQPEETFTYVDISAVDNVTKRISTPQILLGKNAPSRARNIIHAGDVLVATTRPNLNAVALVPSELDNQICSTGFCVLRARANLVPEYLFLFVQSRMLVDSLSDLVKGALYPAVTDSQVLDQCIPLPSLKVQECIADNLTNALAAVEKARQAAQERLRMVKTLQECYLRETFEGVLASDWKNVRIGDVARIQTGFAFKSESHNDEGIRILRNANIHQGFIEWKDVVRVSEDDRKRYASFELHEGDIILTLDRPLVAGGLKAARLSVCDTPALLNQRVARFILDQNRIDSDYFYAFLRSPMFINSIKGHDQSLGVPHISPGQVARVLLPLPQIDVQQRISVNIQSTLAKCSALSTWATDELRAIESLPASLLRIAFEKGHGING